ncbi:hypothetical protein KY316_01970 [Candidatus Woesearchaeota archaeon]|nr:hypothetical protein [Candidatus Woesearchaeota archaeon]
MARNKAQIEMMGLVVIVIILAVAFLFLFYYLAGSGKSAELKQTYQKELLAYNTIGSVLQATTDCRGLDIADLLDDCVSGIQSIDCFGKSSCAYAEAETAKILGEIFTVNNVDYYFFVMSSRQEITLELGDVCPGARTSAEQPLPSRSGQLIVGIDICG